MSHGWDRLGQAIVAERSRTWRTRAEFARAARVSARVIGDLERGRRSNYLDTTKAAVEGALGWDPGSCDAIVNGGHLTRDADPLLVRLHQMWPRLSHDAKVVLVQLAERVLPVEGE